MSNFKDITRFVNLKPSHQLAHFKQAIPEEAKRLLYQQEVDSAEDALEILTKLYEPFNYSTTLMGEILKISQQLNERLRVLKGRIEDAARRYSETLELLSTYLDKLINSRFKHAIADQETRNQLLWDQREMTVDQLVQKAQQLEGFKSNEPVKSKKFLIMTDRNLESKPSCKSRRATGTVASLQTGKKGSSLSRRQSFICWNCRKKGHMAKNCKSSKIGNGFSNAPKQKTQVGSKPKDETSTLK